MVCSVQNGLRNPIDDLQFPFAKNLRTIAENNKLVGSALKEVVCKYIETRQASNDHLNYLELCIDQRVYNVSALILKEDGFHPCDTPERNEINKDIQYTRDQEIEVKSPLHSWDQPSDLPYWYIISLLENSKVTSTIQISAQTINKLLNSSAELEEDIFNKFALVAGLKV